MGGETNETKRGSNGGKARKEKLTPEQRSAIAKEAAGKRWAKKDQPAAVSVPVISETVSIKFAGIPAEINEPAGDIYPTYGGIDRASPKELHCSGCANGNGDHFAGTVEHTIGSVIQVPPTAAPPPVKKPRQKPIPKAFRGASAYAEKRLAEAMKERAEYMGRVAALNAEIPSLVQIVRALGGSNVPAEAFQVNPMAMFGADQVSMGAIPTQWPTTTVTATPPMMPSEIDPGLFQANAGPLPMPRPDQLIPNTSAGGAMDLDYVPSEEENANAHRLPSMGGGWV